MCVSICTGLTPGADAFSITTVPTFANAAANTLPTASAPGPGVGQNSVSGISLADAQAPPNVAAACLYDFLHIGGGRDAVTGNVADRYCGNALNPVVVAVPAAGVAYSPGLPASVQICSEFKQNSNLLTCNIRSHQS
jgi:hypothetical protein